MKRSALVFALGLAAGSILLKLMNFDLPENFALFYALALFCGCFLRGAWAWAIPVASMIIADMAGQFLDDYQLGVYSFPSMCLNYVALSILTGVGTGLRKTNNIWVVAVGSVVGATAFFLISNFGAFLDPRMGHSFSLQGLLKCYADGVPFARGTYASSLLFSVAAFGLYRSLSYITADQTVNSTMVEKAID